MTYYVFDNNLNKLELCMSEINKERRLENSKVKVILERLRSNKEIRRLEDRAIIESHPRLRGIRTSKRNNQDNINRHLHGDMTE